MAYILVPEGLPGIRGLMAFRPETSAPLNDLAEALLRGDNTLSKGERELIATFVSALNDCYFCQNSHGGYAQHFLNCSTDYIDQVKKDYLSAPMSDKMRALLAIAEKVQKGGKNVTEEIVTNAKDKGATDHEIHDTVLIAAAFCMFNRYVDGLGTWAPEDRQYYIERAAERAHLGYSNYDPKQ
ncbi:MAG TPA: peroxidase-related enzyme [Bacteroidales bacterium]|nr:peroxidase-related enzyme [Bacteroidales bacterium]